jgi:uncharacterized membrane protein YfcA
MLRKKVFHAREPAFSKKKAALIAAFISLCIGCYDGFFGPGTGTFLILLYTGLARIEPRTASGNAKLVNLASNIGSLVLFLYHGKSILPLGLTAGLFSIAGSYLGSGLVIRRGESVLKIFIVAVLLLLLAKTAWDLFYR